ncbi:hypothetical protein [Bradyrhizobium liaoningense]
MNRGFGSIASIWLGWTAATFVGLDPDAAVGNALGERLGLAHQLLQRLLQIRNSRILKSLLTLPA